MDRAVPSCFWLGAGCGYIHLASLCVNGAGMITMDFGNKVFSAMGHSGDAFTQTSSIITLIVFVLIVLIL